MKKVRIGIAGYGNLGKGVECAVKEANDMELVAVFTRRNPKNVTILTEKSKMTIQSLSLFLHAEILKPLNLLLTV